MENNAFHTAARALMKINKFVYSIEKIIGMILMYGLVIILFINVLFRFVLFIPSAWADELSRYTFTWLVLIGASIAMYNWEHIDINLVDTLIEKWVKGDHKKKEMVLSRVKKSAVAISIGYLIYLSILYEKYLSQIATLGTKSMFLGWGLTVPMSSILVCSILMAFHGICYLIIPEEIRREVGGLC